MEVKRGEEVKRAINLIKKIKHRKGAEKQETKENNDEDPDIDITIEEIRRRIREEKEAAAGVPKENPLLEQSTDSEFTVTYDGDQGAPEQENEEERARLNLDSHDGDTSDDAMAPGTSNAEEKTMGGKVAKLSPRQRQKR